MVTLKDYQSIKTAWCSGCGNFGILNALKQALVTMGKRPEEVLLCSGIGQAAKLPHYLRCHVFNGLHGRALPVATGAKLANHNLTAIAVGGDRDMYGEGGNHFLHAIRKNVDITLLVHDNKIYGLTKGQASPASDVGVKTKVQPAGVIYQPLNPLALAISQNCSFVARGYSGDIPALAALIKAGIENPGFSVIDVLQPCVSFNKVNTHAWYKERIYPITDDPDHDVFDINSALAKANEWRERIPVGLIFKSDRKSYTSKLPQLQSVPLIDRPPLGEEFAEIIQSFDIKR